MSEPILRYSGARTGRWYTLHGQVVTREEYYGNTKQNENAATDARDIVRDSRAGTDGQSSPQAEGDGPDRTE